MISAPSCHLYLSFVFHLVGLTALLVGYSTPYWTVVRRPSGEEMAKGLVVSCEGNVCSMLHISNARTVLVIVFAMCTVSVLVSVFVLQVSGLAICNNSCRMRNMGTGLSYLSFFIALLNGATLALYHLEISFERNQDDSIVSIGWSQYCVIASSILYASGAVLNIADYVKRNRKVHGEALISPIDQIGKAHELIPQKKLEAQRVLVDKTCQTVGSDTLGQQHLKNGGKTFQTAIKKVSSVVKMANRNVACNKDSEIQPTNSIFVVNKDSNQLVNNVMSGSTSNRYTRTSAAESSINSIDKNRRGRLVKTANVSSTEMPVAIPSLESDFFENSQQNKFSYCTSQSERSDAVEQKGERSDPKYDRDIFETKDKSKLRLGISAGEPCRHCARRGSAVEEALLTVSHLLDGGSGNLAQLSISEASFSNNDSATLDSSPHHSIHDDIYRHPKIEAGSSGRDKDPRRFARLVRKYSHDKNHDKNAPRSNKFLDGSVEDTMGRNPQQAWSENRMKRLHVLASMKNKEKRTRKILE